MPKSRRFKECKNCNDLKEQFFNCKDCEIAKEKNNKKEDK